MLEAAREIALELEGLSAKEREQLAASIVDLATDTPRTELAALRVKKSLAKAKGPAKDILVGTVVKIATKSASSALGL